MWTAILSAQSKVDTTQSERYGVMTFSLETYRQRRKKLAQHIGDGAVAFIPNSSLKSRGGGVHFPHRSSGGFRYLVGDFEPNAVLVLTGGGNSQSILFCVETKDALDAVFDGEARGTKGAKEHFGVDEAYAIESLNGFMQKLLKDCQIFIYPFEEDPQWHARVMNWIRSAQDVNRRYRMRPSAIIVDAYVPLSTMRLIKNPAELMLIEKAMDISAEAIVLAMRACKPGMKEYELEAELTYHARKNGCDPCHAFAPIVAGGDNACILHWFANNGLLKDGELVLIDFGVERNGYPGDLSLAFPVNGKFISPQQEVWEINFAAHQAAMAEFLPGNPWYAPHKAAVRVITQWLVDVGILKGSVEDLIDQAGPLSEPQSFTVSYRPYFPHYVNHVIDGEVHGVGDYWTPEGPMTFEPGMVLSNEPGLYFKRGDPNVPERYWGIGVRYERGVVIPPPDEKPIILGSGLPTTIQEIEALMRH